MMGTAPYLGLTRIATNSAVTPTAETSGQYDGLGIWIPAPVPGAGSGSAPPRCRLVSHSGSRPCTTGVSWKFHSGGGEGIAHSRVAPFQGSAGAFRGPRAVLKMLYRNTRKPSARMNDPAVSIWLRRSKPSSAG